MKTQPPTYALRYEQILQGSGNPLFVGTIIEITPDRDLGWRNAEAREYNNLQVRGYGFVCTWRNNERDVDQFEVIFRPHTVELAEAEAMVKTLRRLDRGLEKLHGTYGRPETFGAYCERVCLTLKIGCMATYSEREGLKLMPVGMGAAGIDRMIEAWTQAA